MTQAQEFRGVARAQTTVNGAKHFVYHKTSVVVRNADGSIRLDSGGWKTATTKLAMNQASNQDGLGFTVLQRDGDWFVTWHGTDRPFFDGMTLVATFPHVV